MSERAPLRGESLDDLYEDAPVGYLTTAPDGTILRCNRTFLALTGHAAGELVGVRRFYDLLPPGAKIYYETHYAPLLQMQQAVRELALELVRADGRRVPVLVNADVRSDPDTGGEVVRLTVLDATQRRRYEQELLQARTEAESRAAAASALQHVSEAVVLLDDDGRVVVLNPAAARLFAFADGDDVLGLPLTALVAGWASIAPRIPTGRSGEPAAPVVVPLAVEGDTRWVAASAEAAADGVVYTLRDVTTDRRLESFRDDIVAIVSHELRTPLAGVFGAAQTLQARGDDLPAPQRQALLAMIVEQSGRLARILDEVLLTQQLDSGNLHVEQTSFDMTAVVERVLERSRGWRATRPVRLAADGAVAAEGDPALFEQALVNLLDNAFKYSPADGEIRVGVERRSGSARVTVADDGPGVAAGDRERIFEKFFRADPAQVSGTTGTGLGLYITRELVRRMHGRVGLEPADAGATFFVDLPLAQ